MNKIVWSDDYSVGDSTMDFQHKKIAAMINSLIDHKNGDADEEFSAELLSEMTKYCLHHLAEEEQLLKQNAYPDFDEHIESHNIFRHKVVQFCTASTAGVEVCPVMLAYLVDWWESHIGIEDQKYRAYI